MIKQRLQVMAGMAEPNGRHSRGSLRALCFDVHTSQMVHDGQKRHVCTCACLCRAGCRSTAAASWPMWCSRLSWRAGGARVQGTSRPTQVRPSVRACFFKQTVNQPTCACARVISCLHTVPTICCYGCATGSSSSIHEATPEHAEHERCLVWFNNWYAKTADTPPLAPQQAQDKQLTCYAISAHQVSGACESQPTRLRNVAAVSPGFVATHIFSSLPWGLAALAQPLVPLIARSPAQVCVVATADIPAGWFDCPWATPGTLRPTGLAALHCLLYLVLCAATPHSA